MAFSSSELLIGVAFVAPLVFFYVLVLRWAGRFDPEPPALLATCFAWGGIVAVGAGIAGISWAEQELASYLSIEAHHELVIAVSDVIFAPFLEELFKMFGLVLLFIASRYWLHELDGLLDGLICGGLVGLGFTLTEDALLVAFASQRSMEAAIDTTVVRTVLGGLGHCTFSALCGAGLGIAIETRRRSVRVLAPVVFFIGAVTLHSIHNLLAGGDAAALLRKILVFWVVDILFFITLGYAVVRQRRIIRRYLEPELGTLLDERERDRVTSFIRLDIDNFKLLFQRGRGLSSYLAASRRQHALVKIALLGSRRARGEEGPNLDAKEKAARWQVTETKP